MITRTIPSYIQFVEDALVADPLVWNGRDFRFEGAIAEEHELPDSNMAFLVQASFEDFRDFLEGNGFELAKEARNYAQRGSSENGKAYTVYRDGRYFGFLGKEDKPFVQEIYGRSRSEAHPSGLLHHRYPGVDSIGAIEGIGCGLWIIPGGALSEEETRNVLEEIDMEKNLTERGERMTAREYIERRGRDLHTASRGHANHNLDVLRLMYGGGFNCIYFQPNQAHIFALRDEKIERSLE